MIDVTNQLMICDIPLRFDTYDGCTHRCSYCFANRKDLHKNKKVVGAKITDSSGKEISQEDFNKKYTEGAKKAQASSYAANSSGGFAETKE